MLPTRIRASLEVIEAELALEFLVLLFDRPALMGQADEAPQRGAGRPMDEVILHVPVGFAFAQEPDLGRQPSSAPSGGRSHAQGGEARPPRGLRPGAPVDPVPRRARQVARDRADRDRAIGLGHPWPCAGTAATDSRARDNQAWPAD